MPINHQGRFVLCAGCYQRGQCAGHNSCAILHGPIKKMTVIPGIGDGGVLVVPIEDVDDYIAREG